MARILVVDDDPSVRALLRDVLELEGHVVQDVADGYAGLRMTEQHRPDCVVLDVMMPGLDGHAVLQRIRAAEGGLDLPVVMLTAAADDETAWRGWSGGVDHVLGKPFDADELLHLLERLCARPGARALSGLRPTGTDGRRC